MEDNIKDIFSRKYQKDFSSLTNDEVKFILQNAFYQYFLIDLSDVIYTVDSNRDGTLVSFVLKGEAYKDPANLSEQEIEELLEDDE